MGITNITGTVASVHNLKKKQKIRFLVDTGASYTVLPLNYVKTLGLKATKTQDFTLADGTIVKRDLGYAMIEIDGQESPSTVILGEKGDSALLGVITLENMGLMVDPFKRKLIPMKLMLA
jgi:clan AA aspartic protease